MNKLKVILGAHSHIPLGSTDEEFELTYQSNVKPLITSLYKFPKIPTVLHYSGVLLQWLEKNHPEFFMLLEELVNRKQVEILGGGFYEPLLPLLPLTDKIGQVELLTTYLRKKIGKRPRGCWLPGMVWEQNLTGALQASGMDYIFLNETQFVAAGFKGPDTQRPCVTEDQGKTIIVYPISNYSEIKNEQEFKQYLRSLLAPAGDDQDRIISFFPNNFAFLQNPEDTQEEAISRVFEIFSSLEDRIELTIPSRSFRTMKIHHKAYFPNSADPQTMYWAMDTERKKSFDTLRRLENQGLIPGATSFVFGAFPRQFLVRYPEANGIYSKMMYTHILINQLRGDKYRKKTAREELWKAQGCDGFWHIGEGGVYRNSLRKAMYRSLLDAEKISRERGVFIPSILAFDFDLDGEREYLFQGSDINCYIKTEGAGLIELDYLPKAWNYLDTFSRRRESYHQELGLEDGYRRAAFLDRLLRPEASLAEAVEGRFPDSRCLLRQTYEMIEIDKVKQGITFKLMPDEGGPFNAVEVEKTFYLKKNVLSVRYRLSNRGVRPERFNFSTQVDLSFAGDSETDQGIEKVSADQKQPLNLENQEVRNLDGLIFHDRRNAVTLTLDSSSSFDAWIMPIRTLCRMKGETVEEYQSTCAVLIKPVLLAPEESWETQFSLQLSHG
jgi:hypothetical protein